jgi:hypothetical protein
MATPTRFYVFMGIDVCRDIAYRYFVPAEVAATYTDVELSWWMYPSSFRREDHKSVTVRLRKDSTLVEERISLSESQIMTAPEDGVIERVILGIWE